MKQKVLLLILFIAPYLSFAQQGLKGEYFAGRNFERYVLTRIDPQLNFNWDMKPPAPGMPTTDYSIRWTGRLQVPETGTYVFSSVVDDGIRLWIGGVKVIEAWGPHDHASITGEVNMKAGQMYEIRIEYFNGILEGQIQLNWEIPNKEKGLMDKLFGKSEAIGSRYFFPPPAPAAEAVPEAKPISMSVAKPETGEKPEPVVKKPEQAPPPKPVVATSNPDLPPPIATPKVPARRKLQDTIEKYTPKNVLFGQGEPFVLEESYPELDRLVKLLTRFESLTVQIEGHTDITGDPQVNLQLSKDRANEVAYYLKEKGIASKRIKTIGFGATRPLSGKDSTRLYPQNRRVEFKIR